MRAIVLCLAMLGLAACQHTIFGDPQVRYQTANTIGVSYVPLKLGLSKEDQAMALIAQHCRGAYRITGRTLIGNTVVLDAACGQ